MILLVRELFRTSCFICEWFSSITFTQKLQKINNSGYESIKVTRKVFVFWPVDYCFCALVYFSICSTGPLIVGWPFCHVFTFSFRILLSFELLKYWTEIHMLLFSFWEPSDNFIVWVLSFFDRREAEFEDSIRVRWVFFGNVWLFWDPHECNILQHVDIAN